MLPTIYHYALGWVAPYGFTSGPKLLGTVGGIALVVGTIRLFRLHLRRHPLHGDLDQRPMDLGFIGLLLLTGATGLVLMLVRGTPAVPLALSVHLGGDGAVPDQAHSEFAHAVYRSAALLKWSIEKRQPNRLQLGAD